MVASALSDLLPKQGCQRRSDWRDGINVSEQQPVRPNRLQLRSGVVGFLQPARMSRECLNDVPSRLALNRQVTSLLPIGNQRLPLLDDATDAGEKRVSRKALQVVGSRDHRRCRQRSGTSRGGGQALNRLNELRGFRELLSVLAGYECRDETADEQPIADWQWC